MLQLLNIYYQLLISELQSQKRKQLLNIIFLSSLLFLKVLKLKNQWHMSSNEMPDCPEQYPLSQIKILSNVLHTNKVLTLVLNRSLLVPQEKELSVVLLFCLHSCSCITTIQSVSNNFLLLLFPWWFWFRVFANVCPTPCYCPYFL